MMGSPLVGLLAVAAVAAAANCSAVDAGLRSRLAAAARGCDVVVYSTLVYGAGVRLPDPRTRLGPAVNGSDGGVCFVLVAGAASAAQLRAHCDVAPWTVVAMDAAATAAAARGDRRASRLLKLNPLPFFPGARFLVFVDWKLRLLRPPRALVAAALGGGHGFAAFRHPCTCAYTRPRVKPCDARRAGEPWWRTEARLVARKTADAAALERQVARYAATAVGEYVDGALLLWDAAHPAAAALSCGWWTEYARDDSSDRDQLAFARAITALVPPAATDVFDASTRAGGVFLIAEGRSPACEPLCHPYEQGAKTTVESAGPRVAPPRAPPPPAC